MTQYNLFPTIHGQVDVKGDVATSTTNVLWTIEKQEGNAWVPVAAQTFSSRYDARVNARYLRLQGYETRVVPYKCAIDAKARANRQVRSMRLDY